MKAEAFQLSAGMTAYPVILCKVQNYLVKIYLTGFIQFLKIIATDNGLSSSIVYWPEKSEDYAMEFLSIKSCEERISGKI